MKLPANKGFTLIELLVVMGIFSLVIVMVGSSFTTLLRYSTRFLKTEESNIEGNVALEIFRHDISSAGFGLPTSFNGTPAGYTEIDTSHALAASLNDTQAVHIDAIPRAVVGAANIGSSTDTGHDGLPYTLLAGSDYLALKATSLGTEPAVQKWTYAGYTSLPPKKPKIWASGNLVSGDQVSGDRVIALNRSASATDGGYNLLLDGGKFWTSYSDTGLSAPYSAQTPQDMVYIYGIAGNGVTPRMPFNRADYFVAKPGTAGKLPTYCAPNTGILYRGLARHEDGSLDYQPLVDCVAAMHVVLGWNMADSTGALVTDPTKTGSGAVDTWSTPDGSSISSSTSIPINQLQSAVQAAVKDAGQVRTKLKVVKVYVLAQNGNKDVAYTSPNTVMPLYSGEEGALGTGATYTLAPEMLNYRWKVYKLVIRPKNLVSNQ